MNKYKRLFNDSIIYMIGNFGSKLVSLIMVSFYTFNLSSSDYGSTDVALTTIALIIPIVTCCVHTAILRYAIKSEYEPAEVISCGLSLFILNTLLLVVLAAITLSFTKSRLLIWIVMLVIVEGLNTILLQYCRAVDKTKLYAFTGIVLTFSIALFNIVFLKYLKLGINGYFLAYFLGYIVSIAILTIGTNLPRSFRISKFSISLSKEMLRFSLPLIPSSLMWWAMNALDKYVILYYLGTEWNGLYAVAGKIPTILSTFSVIFMQAWQVSAIIEHDSKERDQFYTNVFNGLLLFNVLCFCALMMIIRPVLTYFISSSYPNTWKYVPFLLLSTICSSLISFLGASYIASKETKGELVTSMIGGIANLFLNFILIKAIGLNGAAISTAISFFIVILLRIRDTKKYVSIHYDFRTIGSYFLLIAVQIVSIYCFPMIVSSIISIIAILILLLKNKTFVTMTFRKVIAIAK